MQHPLMRALAGAAALVLAVASTVQAQAGITSNQATVTLNATKASTLTVTPSVASADLLAIADNSNANNFPGFSVTTDWNLTSGTTVALVGWFGTPATALANGAAAIPSSRVEASVNGGSYNAFGGAAVAGVGVAGGTLLLSSQAVAANLQNSATDNLALRLNLVGFPTTTAGLYTGTLNLQAVVQ
jgi:hypothetical protein